MTTLQYNVNYLLCVYIYCFSVINKGVLRISSYKISLNIKITTVCTFCFCFVFPCILSMLSSEKQIVIYGWRSGIGGLSQLN